MLCCLNPDCSNPHNPDTNQFCHSCSTPLVLLRNHYRVIGLLSTEGGFGRTYLAEDLDRLNERCVVKQLAPKNQATWAIKKSIELFGKEARRLQQMGEHPQIPTLLAYFEENNFLYMVQQWIDGENLSKLLHQHGSWQENEVRNFLLDILPVIQFIHERCVIHRDIKPANIMRRSLSTAYQGEATGSQYQYVLIDFGASKQLAEATVAARGTQIGTFGYAPIEQMKGGEAYPASDLYSLGVTCFYLLTLTDPHSLFLDRGFDWVANWQQYLRHPLSSQFSEVLSKLLKKDVQLRYQSANEVLQDLYQSGNEAIKDWHPQPILQETPTETDSVTAATAIAPSEVPSAVPPTVWTAPATWAAPATPQTGNWKCIRTLGGWFSGHSNWVYSVAFSPDGHTLASGSHDKTIKLWNLATGQEICTLKGHVDSVYSLTFSPDGQTLASGSPDKTIKLWNVATGQLIRTLMGHSNWVYSVAFSPNGQTLASGSLDKTIKLWSGQTGEEISTLVGHSNWVHSVAFSPDGQTLASGSLDKTIKLWDVLTGQLIRTLVGHSNWVYSVAISPDGHTLASGSGGNTIKLWDIPTGQQITTLVGHSNWVYSVAISPDGQTLVSGSGDNTIKLWDIPTGQQIQTLKGHSDWIHCVAISPDGQLLASGSRDKTIKIWRVSS